MDQARRIAPLLMADIAAGILAGAVFFCVGDDDGSGSWDAFELEGEQAFAQLLGQDFGVAGAAGRLRPRRRRRRCGRSGTTRTATSTSRSRRRCRARRSWRMQPR